MIIMTITIITITTADGILAADSTIIGQRTHMAGTAGIDQLTHTVGTGQHPTLAGTDQPTTTIARLITADGAAHTAVTTTTTAAMADLAAGKLSKKFFLRIGNNADGGNTWLKRNMLI